MDWKKEIKLLIYMLGIFFFLFYLPIGNARFDDAVMSALKLVRWYAREHIILCLIPAFFIAGAISVFINDQSVIKYLGPSANKILAYGVASVSGTILAVCSCTVLPLFAGIYQMGAGLGPASAFLYSGPAINVLAIILTARILGLEIGVARALGAIIFSIIIGLLMALFFHKEEKAKKDAQLSGLAEPEVKRALWKNVLYFGSMLGILVFANWGKPLAEAGFWYQVYSVKWLLTGICALGLGVMLVLWFGLRWWKFLVVAFSVLILAVTFPDNHLLVFGVGLVIFSIFISQGKGELGQWFISSYGFAKQILPLLLAGVLVAGFLLGEPNSQGVIPSQWVAKLVGGNSLPANFFASIVGAFMYFATLTEVPILQGLIGSGMGKGPALALLLAGPAVSLPNMLVLRGIMGAKKTLVYIVLVVVMASITGIIFGAF